MKLVIQHSTIYRYDVPVNYSIQYLRLTPKPDACQNILRWRVETPGQAREMTDAYGNIMHVLVVDEPHQEIAIRVIGEAETFETAGVVSGENDPLPVGVFLRSTHLTTADDNLRDLVAPLAPAIAKDRVEGLLALSACIAKAVAYRQGETHAESTAAQALALGSGVCQDQAHVFLAAARALGVPARYVSGYIHVANGNEDASHAWAEAWVDSLGWVGFDVANQIFPTESHLRLAVGLDYLACAPVRGIRRGGGDEDMAVSVSVSHGRHPHAFASQPPHGAPSQNYTASQTQQQ